MIFKITFSRPGIRAVTTLVCPYWGSEFESRCRQGRQVWWAMSGILGFSGVSLYRNFIPPISVTFTSPSSYHNFKIEPHYYSTRKNDVYFLQETKCHTTAGMKHSINFVPRFYNSLIKSNPELHELSKTNFKKKN